MSLAPGEALPGHTTGLCWGRLLWDQDLVLGQSGVHGEHQDLTAGEGEGQSISLRSVVHGVCWDLLCVTSPSSAAVWSLAVRTARSIAALATAGRGGNIFWLAEGMSGWGCIWGRQSVDSIHGLYPSHQNRRASAPVERAVSLSALPGATRKLPFLIRARLYLSAETGACVRAAEANIHPTVLHLTSWGRANTSAKGLEVFIAEVGK